MISILLADDSPAFLASVTRFIEGEPGLAVVGRARTGREAVEQATRLRPDLVLMDIAMPEMDGLEATRLIKANLGGVRVILVTLHDVGEYRTAALGTGADAFVAKHRLIADLPPLLRVMFPPGGPEVAAGSLFDSVPIGLFRTAPDGRILDANPALVEMLGFPDRDALLAAGAASLYAVTAERAEVLAGQDREGIVRGAEVRLRRRDGTFVWARSNVRAVREADGRVVFYEGSLEDVTDRKRAEAALAERETLLSAIADAEPECIKLTAPDGTVTSMNAAGLAMLEAESTADVVGRPFLAHVVPEQREAAATLVGHVLRGERRSGAFEIVGLKGTRRWVEAHVVPLRDAGGAVVAALSVTRDLSGQHRAEQALWQRETRFRALIENSADAIALLDAEGTIRYATPSTTRMLGWPLDDLLGRNGFEFLHPLDHEMARARLAEALERPAANVMFHVRARHRDGSWRYLEGILTNLLAEPSVRAIVNNYRDVTDRRRAEDATAALAEVGRVLSESLDLDVVARVVTDRVCRLLGAEAAAVYRAGRDAADLELLAASGEGSWDLSDPNLLAVPLRVRARVFGVLVVRDRAGRTFDAPTMELVRAFADQAALSLENARLHAESEHRRRVAERMAELGTLVSQSLESEDVSRAIVESVRDLLGATNAVLFHLDPASRERTVLAVSGEAGPRLRPGQVLGPDLGASGLAMRERRVVTSLDVLADPAIVLSPEVRRRLGTSRIRAALAVPMVVKGRTVGAITAGAPVGRTFGAADVEMVNTFAAAAAVALDNARLYSEARREIDERTHAEEALREGESRFRSLIENAQDIITVLAADGTFTYQSPSIERILGYGRDELIGHHVSEYVHPEDRSGIAGELQHGIATPGYVGRAEYRFRHRDGSWRILESVGQSLLADPVVAGIVVNSRDVTERRRSEEIMRLTEKLASMGQLLAGVAHELNNPLSVVVGRAALLRAALHDERLATQVAKLSEAAERCGRIVKNFLSLARQKPAAREAVALNRIVREAVELLAYPLRVDDVEVEVRFDPDLPVVWGDPSEIHQVIVNLVTNAQQAMQDTPPPRRLTITTRGDVAAGQVIVEVSDSGPGVPEELRARIFEPFFTTKPVGQGTGLGLSICHGIIRAHGGEIQVENAAGGGACFTIRLPLGEPSPDAAGPEDAADASPPLRGKAILVVDDEPDVVTVLAEFLAGEGHRVETVTSGAAALEKIAASPWDLILCDLRMPELSGAAVYRTLERARPDLLTHLVFMTGDWLGDEATRFIEELRARGVATVAKPFDFGELERIVQRVLAGTDRV